MITRTTPSCGRARALVTLVAAAPLVLGTTLGASAEPDEPLSIEHLPSLDEATISQERQAIDIPDIEPFEPEVSSSGGDTVVTLNTDVLFEFGKAQLSDPAQEAVREAIPDVIEKDRENLDLTVKGRGEQDPVAPNESGGKDNPKGREKNRRVEIRYAG